MTSAAKPVNLDLTGCRCVSCGGIRLKVATQVFETAIHPGAVQCEDCGGAYDVIKGIPYLLVFEERDFMSLVEIAAAFDATDFSEATAVPYDDTWPKMLDACYNAADRTAYRATVPANMKTYFEDRFQQWCELEALSGKIDLAGKHVLVLGAGMGFDANFILLRGANVTAVDLNPQMNVMGKLQTPKARWIGGMGRRLPFVDCHFDYVFINAALHHVTDTSATILEMYRVVKPGGAVITTSDSYANDAMTDLEDAHFWNTHEAVLRGVNENRHRMHVYVDPMLAHVRAGETEIEFWTSRAFGVWVESEARRIDYLEPRQWNLDKDEEALRSSSGGEIFTRTTKNRHFERRFDPPAPAITTPIDMERFIGRKRDAMAFLAHLAPDDFVSPNFPGPAGNTKFQVLNGWRWSEDGEDGREVYLLGRWFIRRAKPQTHLEVVIGAPPIDGTPAPVFSVAINGAVLASQAVPRGQTHRFFVDVANIATGTPFAVEIAMETGSSAFEQGLFRTHLLRFPVQN